ncbi:MULTISPECIES: cellulose synthase operon protein YhjQ/BcsQ [unclassified Cupriavidus]|uniref:cellulose synthase operon protein YhjQ/BcsQ n=1 Tax=unclassified Cupriavidus TaxID=2640874 RepID=UPI0010F4A07F|nr:MULTISPECIES: cellulose synthase operon protein YhjQ/BcsQ [unclassified Cupriavidus]MWL90645.1 pilus assembly protein [Cupriavidus sp. SW-Y-13]
MDDFLLNTTHEEVRHWLGHALQGAGRLVAEDGAQEAFIDQIGALRPGLVFLDFTAAHASASARLAEQVVRLFPQLPMVAVGHAAESETMLTAMRAGVRDFIDLRGAPAQATAAVKRLVVPRAQVRAVTHKDRHGKVVALLGARPGVGVTSLAVNLAAAVRQRQDAEVLLLDLGLPARDGALYLNIAPEFHFVEAVRNVRRFDHVFVQTALARHANGVSVLPLPATLAELRDISYSEALTLFDRLRAFFDLQVIDLGGFTNAEFMAQIVKAADAVVLVAEQSVGAIVSAAEVVQELHKREVERQDMHLLVSRFDPELGVEAQQIAERIGVSSVGTLPDRRAALLQAANRGVVLADEAPADPYVRALGALMERLGYHAGQLSERGILARIKDKLPDALRVARTARAGN